MAAPEVDAEAPLQMLVVTLDYSDYVGRIGIGHVVAGKIRKGQRIALLKEGKRIDDTVATERTRCGRWAGNGVVDLHGRPLGHLYRRAMDLLA